MSNTPIFTENTWNTAGVIDPYSGKNTTLTAWTNPLEWLKNALSLSVGWCSHLLRWLILLATQSLSMILIHLMMIAFMLSLIPFFKAVDLELLKTFIALKFVPAILAIMDYVFDAMNIMNLSINTINRDIDVGSASIGYALMKIFLSFASVYLSFKLFHARANPFKTGENESWLWKNGGLQTVKFT